MGWYPGYLITTLALPGHVAKLVGMPMHSRHVGQGTNEYFHYSLGTYVLTVRLALSGRCI